MFFGKINYCEACHSEHMPSLQFSASISRRCQNITNKRRTPLRRSSHSFHFIRFASSLLLLVAVSIYAPRSCVDLSLCVGCVRACVCLCACVFCADKSNNNNGDQSQGPTCSRLKQIAQYQARKATGGHRGGRRRRHCRSRWHRRPSDPRLPDCAGDQVRQTVRRQ